MMDTYQVTIRTENEAFSPDPSGEVARILRALADDLDKHGPMERAVHDGNGNRVGEVRISD